MPLQRRFVVHYARVVTMRVEVELRVDPNDPDTSTELADDGRLPNVFEGISSELIGEHIKEVVDCEDYYAQVPSGEPYHVRDHERLNQPTLWIERNRKSTESSSS